MAEFATSVLDVMRALGPELPETLRAGVLPDINALWAREYAKASDDRKLGLQLLRQAAEVFERILRSVLDTIPDVQAFAAVLPAVDALGIEGVARSMDGPSVAVLRLEMDVFVAFDLASEPDAKANEFSAWAKRAAESSRRAAEMLEILQWWRPPTVTRDEMLKLVQAHAAITDEPMDAAIWIRRNDVEAWLVEVLPELPDDSHPERPTQFTASRDFRHRLNLIAANRASLEAAIGSDSELARWIVDGEVLHGTVVGTELVELARTQHGFPAAG